MNAEERGHALCPADQGRLDPVGLRTIARNQPQLLVDDYLIESRFDANALAATVPHVLHRPERVPEPVLRGQNRWEPRGVTQPSVLYDARANLFRMYYTSTHADTVGTAGYPPGTYFLCYAESEDGLSWRRPALDRVPWGDVTRTNILMQGIREAKIAHVHVDNGPEVSAAGNEARPRNIGMLPPAALNGHRFVMYYGDGPHWLATSEDGLHWEERVHQVIANRIDCYQTIVHDEGRQEYVSFLRNKLIFGEPRKAPPGLGGNTRMISRVSSPDLWTLWDTMPVSVLIPDAGDAERFYGMPTFRYGGVYLGMLQQFHEHPQTLQVELVTSRDGISWQRLPGRPLWLACGAPGTWDCGMVTTGDHPIEVDNEWRFYYGGWNGHHDDPTDRTSCIGMARCGKERLVSVQAGDTESYVLTRPLHWPGGSLVVNADASRGMLTVRVTDLRRNTLPGLDHADCVTVESDGMRHQVHWKEAELAGLDGKMVRLEFRLRNADLFAFLAAW